MSIQNALASATSNIVNSTISANVKKQKEADTKASLEAKQQKEAEKLKAKAVKQKQLDVDNEIRRKTMVDKGIAEGLNPMASIPQGTSISGLLYAPYAQQVAQQSLERVKMLANQKMMLRDAKARAKFRNKARKGGK